MIPLLTMLSMIGVAAVSAAAASSCFPALSAKVAFRMALRSCEVRASLRVRCAVDCRAAFSADFVFAKRETPQGTGSVGPAHGLGPHSGWTAHGLDPQSHWPRTRVGPLKRAAYSPVQVPGCQCVRRLRAS